MSAPRPASGTSPVRSAYRPPWALRALSWMLSLFPRRLVLGLGAALGTLVYAVGIRRKVALENARLALGDEVQARAAVKAAYRNVVTYLIETFLALRLSDAELAEAFRIPPKIDALLQAGNGLVACLGHFGNWELFGVAAARRGYPFYAITRRLKGPLNALVHGARAVAGMQELAPKGSFQDALALLRAKKAVAVIIDQNMLRSRGIFVEFFGRLACTTPAPAVMAQRTGAPVIACFPVREGPMRYRLEVEGPFDPPASVEEHTQRLARVMEAYVRRYPDHWFWLHRRWKTRPEGEVIPAVRAGSSWPSPPAAPGPRGSR